MRLLTHVVATSSAYSFTNTSRLSLRNTRTNGHTGSPTAHTAALPHWLDNYNTRRPHSAIGDRPPNQPRSQRPWVGQLAEGRVPAEFDDVAARLAHLHADVIRLVPLLDDLDTVERNRST